MAEDEGKAPRDEVMEAAVGTEQSATGAGDHSKGEAETTALSGDVEMGEEGEKSNGDNEGEKKAEEEKKRRSWSRSPQRSRSRSPRRRRSRERRRSSRSRERSSRHRRRSDRHRDDDRDYDRRHRSSRSDRYRRERDYERDYERDRRDYDRDRHYRSRKRSREYDDDEERHSRSKRRRSYSRSPHRRERSGRSAWDSRAPATDASDEHLSDVEKARRYAERQQQQMFRNQHSHAKFAPPPAANMACRIYAGNMPYDGVTEEMVREVFAPYGPLKAINMVPDNQTGEFRGFCFIDFQQPEQAVAAQALDGQMFAGRPLRIGPPALPRGGHGYAPSPVPGGRMFVGSVSYDMTADDVGDLCKLFGEVFSCQLIPNPDNGRHKGYGFVEFSTAAAAKRAIIQLEGFEFGGRTLHTGEAKSQPGDGSPSSEATALAPEVDIAKLNAVARQLEQRAMARPPPLPMGHRRPPPAGMHGGPPGMYGGPRRGPPGMGRGVPEKPKQLHRNIPLAGMPQHMLLAIGNQQNKNSLSKEDDISISGKQRFLVMQKLANQMKECKTVCLRNMVTIDEVDDELEEEVTEECAKFGEVEKVVIYEEPLTRGNVDVQVYVFFKTLEASKRAQEALNGRFFAKKQIIAEFAPTTPF